MLSVRTRLDKLAQQHPEWRSWLAVCEVTLRELENPVWHTLELLSQTEPSPSVPLLDGMQLRIDGTVLRDWLGRLRQCAAVSHASSDISRYATEMRHVDACALLTAAVRQDSAWLQTQADAIDTESRALSALAQLIVMPLLHECRRRLADRLPSSWTQGYCPVCGAWAVTAEVRGIERTRHLRCGRCGVDWRTQWLRCPLCGESSHERLAILTIEGQEKPRSIATCSRCHSYIKTLTTLQGAAPQEIMLDDLATVELDVVALDRGYTRPSRPGYSVQLHITERTRSWSSLLRRFS
jgi:FdhE protein